MRTIDEFLHIADETARKFKRKFPKEDLDELVSDANLHLWEAFLDADKDKSKGELDVFLRRRVVWRILDGIRRRRRLWTDSERRVKFRSLSRFDDASDRFESDLSNVFYVGFNSDERKRKFLEDVSVLVDLALQGKPEETLMFKLVFIDGLSDVEISRQRRVKLKVVRKKRNDLLETIRPYLGTVRLGKRRGRYEICNAHKESD